ncbi:MAG: WecB/TagA/CpsF family glycosyltransferase [Patescibacteria group bacterium]|nr:WecB/TagA/CpsF family glycosyltransferase [Patescibacteria group bacterium]
MNNSFNSVYILGIRIDVVDLDQAIKYIFKIVKKKEQAIITPLNPEIILSAQKDDGLKKIINNSKLSPADGIGVVWAAKFLGFERILPLVKGRILAKNLIELCMLKKVKIALIGDKTRNAIKTAKKFKSEYIKGFVGPMLLLNGLPQTKNEQKKEELLLEKLKTFSPRIVLVGFGCPKQEKWLNRILPKLDNVVGVVVGGTFDYMSEKMALPPKFFENLEWFWRLLIQPKRFLRILKATIVFPCYVFLSKLLRF